VRAFLVAKFSDREIQNILKENEELKAQLRLLLEGNSKLSSQIEELQTNLNILIKQINKQNKKQYASKNEHYNPRQGAAETSAAAAVDAGKAPVTSNANDKDAPLSTSRKGKPLSPEEKEKRAQKRKERTEAIAALASRSVNHTFTKEQLICSKCNKALKVFSQNVSYQIEKLKCSIEVIEHLQEVASCQSCKQTVATAPKPPSPIPGCVLGPRFLADINVKRLADGTPFYRAKKIYTREGFPVPLANLSNWQIALASATTPLFNLIKNEILLSEIIKTDDTDFKIQVPKLKLRKLRSPRPILKGKMTSYIGDKNHNFNLFDFSPDKSFARNIAFFSGYSGYIQADGATGFDVLFKDGKEGKSKAIEVGCHAHARRKFYDCLTTHIQDANFVLDIYYELFEIERKLVGKSTEEILNTRQLQAKPLLDKLKVRLLELKPTLSPGDDFLKAADYFLKNWEALTRYLSVPELDISNNDTERSIKDFVICRKNILFAGSVRAGHAAAVLKTLISSAIRNNLNPVDYLTDVFARISTVKDNPELLKQLLPDRWTPPDPEPEPEDLTLVD
jgi:transposase